MATQGSGGFGGPPGQAGGDDSGRKRGHNRRTKKPGEDDSDSGSRASTPSGGHRPAKSRREQPAGRTSGLQGLADAAAGREPLHLRAPERRGTLYDPARDSTVERPSYGGSHTLNTRESIPEIMVGRNAPQGYVGGSAYQASSSHSDVPSGAWREEPMRSNTRVNVVDLLTNTTSSMALSTTSTTARGPGTRYDASRSEDSAYYSNPASIQRAWPATTRPAYPPSTTQHTAGQRAALQSGADTRSTAQGGTSHSYLPASRRANIESHPTSSNALQYPQSGVLAAEQEPMGDGATVRTFQSPYDSVPNSQVQEAGRFALPAPRLAEPPHPVGDMPLPVHGTPPFPPVHMTAAQRRTWEGVQPTDHPFARELAEQRIFEPELWRMWRSREPGPDRHHGGFRSRWEEVKDTPGYVGWPLPLPYELEGSCHDRQSQKDHQLGTNEIAEQCAWRRIYDPQLKAPTGKQWVDSATNQKRKAKGGRQRDDGTKDIPQGKGTEPGGILGPNWRHGRGGGPPPGSGPSGGGGSSMGSGGIIGA